MAQRSFSIDVDGQAVRGTVYLAEGEDRRRPLAVMLHGFTDDRIGVSFMYTMLGRALNDAGIHAVSFDFRGSGESDGTFGQMLVSDHFEDAKRVLRWAAGQRYADRSKLALVGFSLGGLLASCVSAGDVPVAGLVLLAPTTPQNLRRRAERTPAGQVVTVGPHALHPRYFEDLQQFDSVADVVRRPRPTLMVLGTADAHVAPQISGQYEQAMREANVPLEVVTIEGADHTFNSPPGRLKMVDAVVSFLAATLPRSS